MSLSPEIKAAARLTRPDQWSILTFQFMVPVMLVAPAARGGGCWLNPASGALLAVAWLVWVVFLNGGTLAFNSAYDRDTGPVAYLPNPPQPPPWLAAMSALVMVAAVGLGWLVVGTSFALVVGTCVLLSILYSHPRFRLKARPGFDLLVNMLGYGGGTTLAGLLAGKAAYFGAEGNACAAGGWRTVPWPGLQGPLVQQFQTALGGGLGWFVLGFALLFGSFYPQTQIYQMDDDRQRGDQTLCTKLGSRPALLLGLVLALLAAACFARGLLIKGDGWSLLLPAAGLAAWLGHILVWRNQEPGLDSSAQEKKMYRAMTLWALVDASLLAAWYF